MAPGSSCPARAAAARPKSEPAAPRRATGTGARQAGAARPKAVPPPKVIKPRGGAEARSCLPVTTPVAGQPAPTPPSRPAARARHGAAAGRTSTTPGSSSARPVPASRRRGHGGLLHGRVQQKIWTLWTPQSGRASRGRDGELHILANGSVEDVRVVQSSGASMLDFRGQRSVLSAAPFHTLPKDYGTNRNDPGDLRPTTLSALARCCSSPGSAPGRSAAAAHPHRCPHRDPHWRRAAVPIPECIPRRGARPAARACRTVTQVCAATWRSRVC